MDSLAEEIFDITFGRWKSQTLYAGLVLGVFEALNTDDAIPIPAIAKTTNTNPTLLRRLLRSLVSLGVLNGNAEKGFTLSPTGTRLTESHPDSLKWMVMLEEGPEHYAIWSHLPEMVKTGQQNAFQLEYGQHAFDYATHNPSYASIFNNAMSSFSSVQSLQALESLSAVDMSSHRTICDIAGGQGHLLCSILKSYPHTKGILFDLQSVVDGFSESLQDEFGVADRLAKHAGDMFKAVPRSDDYVMKMILHDWGDEDCIKILKNIKKNANSDARLFIVEHIVPESEEAHFSKFYDMHMMCWGGDQERTPKEYESLLINSGWKYVAHHPSKSGPMGIIVASLS